MLSKNKIICPENLIKIAKSKGVVKAVIVNAGKLLVMQATMQAVNVGLIEPIFIGEKLVIEKLAKDLKWDISSYEIINETDETLLSWGSQATGHS